MRAFGSGACRGLKARNSGLPDSRLRPPGWEAMGNQASCQTSAAGMFPPHPRDVPALQRERYLRFPVFPGASSRRFPVGAACFELQEPLWTSSCSGPEATRASLGEGAAGSGGSCTCTWPRLRNATSEDIRAAFQPGDPGWAIREEADVDWLGSDISAGWRLC